MLSIRGGHTHKQKYSNEIYVRRRASYHESNTTKDRIIMKDAGFLFAKFVYKGMKASRHYIERYKFYKANELYYQINVVFKRHSKLNNWTTTDCSP